MMPQLLTAIMYHYVRPIADSLYPGIKGLELKKFCGQLDYFEKYYQFVSITDILRAAKGESCLPPRSILLTFDDGLIDHYQYVFPELKRRGLPAAFYISAICVEGNKVLDVQKIHYILAQTQDYVSLIHFIHKQIENNRQRYELKTLETYWSEYAKANAWDPKEIIYVKRMLQHALPLTFREELIDLLFAMYVSDDEKAFSKKLYMNHMQLNEMAQNNMHIGAHSYNHVWLEKYTPEEQEKDIMKSKNSCLA